eukprot:CAMPEP_0201957234 /NCGR_PEP_ID=MMETSP0904-20121228/4642_1 /ASSEMBLY_ACC=CAM_ASM_000553 /TAXON_ID=420261 /ORGANISM="Thalassiosira antarctica, Strain CCMP982" /LENGTH=116 /DNA_ID=CAMNT_0048502175 /DNA_START=359 /DNA_END=710 /DNA_ORIENTATION=-
MATLLHVKYYNYDKWEMEEYARKKREAEEATASKDGGSGGSGGDGGDVALDELCHKEEMAEREKKQRLEQTAVEKRDKMKHQAQLHHQMAMAYKTGDEETRKWLQKRLDPEAIVKR